MAEEAQNNEMEDILSSIKNILEKDEQKQTAQPDNDALQEDVIVAVSANEEDTLNSDAETTAGETVATETSVEDEILDLSPEMRIAEEAVKAVLSQDEDEADTSESVEAPSSPEENISLASDEDEVETNIAEPIQEDMSDSNNQDIQSETTEEPSLSDENAPDEDDNLLATEEAEPTLDDLLDSQDEAPTPETAFIEAESEETDSVFDIEENTSEASIDELMEDNSDTSEKDIDETIANIVTKSDDQEEIELPKMIAEEASVDDNILPEVDDLPAPLDVDADINKTSNDTADVSANIISNFAKMFSKEEPKHKREDKSPVIDYVGDTTKTLEDFVLDAITKVIGSEIRNQWKDGADYSSFAQEEIKRQTTAWINDNLPTLVEKIVKKEIERVIAKVGSQNL